MNAVASIGGAPVDVVGRVASVLRALASFEPGGASTSEAARAAGLSRPTAHRLLTSLAQQGLVDRGESDGRWVLGPELYLLGAAAQTRYDITSLAQPYVRRLALTTEESAFFSVRRGDETVCLLREDGSFPLRSHVLHEGIRFPLGVASAGLAILAFLPDREVDGYLERAQFGDFAARHPLDEVRANLTRTRRAGFAVNPGLIVQGSWGMAAAVFNPKSVPIGALSLTGVEHRFDETRRTELGRLLLSAAHDLTQSLSRQPRGSSAR